MSFIAVSRFKINLLGVIIDVGSLGSVCTHPDYRGRGLAGSLLAHVENELRAQGVDLLYVSGGRSLYLRGGLHVGRANLDVRCPEKSAPGAGRAESRSPSRFERGHSGTRQAIPGEADSSHSSDG